MSINLMLQKLYNSKTALEKYNIIRYYNNELPDGKAEII